MTSSVHRKVSKEIYAEFFCNIKLKIKKAPGQAKINSFYYH